MVSLRIFLPVGSKGDVTDVRAELKVLTRPLVMQGLAVTVLSSGAMFALYTYINPALQSFTSASPAFIAGMLALVGVGFTIGNSIGGKLADRSIKKTIIGFLLLDAVSMILFPWVARTHIGAAIGLLIWAAAAFALVPPVQMQVMRAAKEAPGLASSVNIGAFNFGNAIGAAAGAVVLKIGMGYAAVMFSGAVLAIFALAVILWSAAKSRAKNTMDIVEQQVHTC
jgi:DHA1 family inner membrane transport protein